jgi:hypothetical protein
MPARAVPILDARAMHGPPDHDPAISSRISRLRLSIFTDQMPFTVRQVTFVAAGASRIVPKCQITPAQGCPPTQPNRSTTD